MEEMTEAGLERRRDMFQMKFRRGFLVRRLLLLEVECERKVKQGLLLPHADCFFLYSDVWRTKN